MRNCTKFYIDGQWVDPVEENTQPVENPATEETIGYISFGTKADVDKAVAAARGAFETFSQTSKEERLTLLRAIQAEIENRKEELATAVSDEMGAPMSLANGPHVGLLAGHCQKAIEILERLVEEAPRVKHKTILGRCLAELGHPQKARDMLQQAVADYEESSFFLQRDNESWITQARQMLETIPVQLN